MTENLKQRTREFLKSSKHPSRSIKRYPELLKDILLATDYLPIGSSLKQRIYHIIYEPEVKTCKNCENPVRWSEGKNNYIEFCSDACLINHVSSVYGTKRNPKNKSKKFTEPEVQGNNLYEKIQDFLAKVNSERPIITLKRSILYQELLKETNYLLNSATQVQRIYHLKHGHFTAVCEVCFSRTKFHNSQYRRTCSGSCGFKLQQREYLEAYNHKHGTDYKNVSSIPSVKEKKIKSSLEKYGTTNVSKSREVKKKISDSNSRTDRNVEEKEDYYNQVLYWTKINYDENVELIDPYNLRGSEYHLDHIYSVIEGFVNNVPPEVIGHFTNLRIIKKRDNLSKNSKCDKTLKELYEDYEKNKGD